MLPAQAPICCICCICCMWCVYLHLHHLCLHLNLGPSLPTAISFPSGPDFPSFGRLPVVLLVVLVSIAIAHNYFVVVLSTISSCLPRYGINTTYDRPAYSHLHRDLRVAYLGSLQLYAFSGKTCLPLPALPTHSLFFLSPLAATNVFSSCTRTFGFEAASIVALALSLSLSPAYFSLESPSTSVSAFLSLFLHHGRTGSDIIELLPIPTNTKATAIYSYP
ncbi:hypothetical protein F5Y01DRAFT_1542 [Xylaria sp. FL0043]|nr:hypothetical protein F5Y01DRAFT_1542 [Xylaria sp. FL0043]